MIKHKNNAKIWSRGFTIVELLIVIVVIGILAAIVIVAYNGVTNKAQSARLVSTADNWEKILRLYEAENDSLPEISDPDNVGAAYYCLGSEADYPATADFAEGQCVKDQYQAIFRAPGPSEASVYHSQDFINSWLPSSISAAPSGKFPTVHTRGVYIRGIVYAQLNAGPNGAHQYLLMWAAPNRGDCGRGSGSGNLSEDDRNAIISIYIPEMQAIVDDPNSTPEEKELYAFYITFYQDLLSGKNDICENILRTES